MSEHTKGPWRYEYTRFDNYLVATKGEDTLVSGAVMTEDDARLIAAAPDLLEALELIALEKPCLSGAFPGDPYMYSQSDHKIARAAIAKAKGEKEWNSED